MQNLSTLSGPLSLEISTVLVLEWESFLKIDFQLRETEFQRGIFLYHNFFNRPHSLLVCHCVLSDSKPLPWYPLHNDVLTTNSIIYQRILVKYSGNRNTIET